MAFSLGSEAGRILAAGILITLIGLTGWIPWSIHTRQADIQILFLTAAATGGWANVWDRISRAADGPLTGTVVDYIAVERSRFSPEKISSQSAGYLPTLWSPYSLANTQSRPSRNRWEAAASPLQPSPLHSNGASCDSAEHLWACWPRHPLVEEHRSHAGSSPRRSETR